MCLPFFSKEVGNKFEASRESSGQYFQHRTYAKLDSGQTPRASSIYVSRYTSQLKNSFCFGEGYLPVGVPSGCTIPRQGDNDFPERVSCKSSWHHHCLLRARERHHETLNSPLPVLYVLCILVIASQVKLKVGRRAMIHGERVGLENWGFASLVASVEQT
jgi:hypothetical protein